MVINFTGNILRNLNSGLDSIACATDENPISYSEFEKMVGAIQGRIHRATSQVIGVITQNQPETYAGIVALWLTGKAYVPINPTYPAERIAVILEEAGIQEIIYAQETAEMDLFRSQFPNIQFITVATLSPALPFNTYPEAEKTAYILFTSGTTGKPKGVPISFGNLQSFFNAFSALGYELGPNDRFLQMFELTFDLSVMSFAVPLMIGASFYTLPNGMIKTLGLYHVLESREITFSLMVPSAIQLLTPYLDDISLPHLRYSQFCGEALKYSLIERWQKCIPNAVIDNVYGPTEATIYCTNYRVYPETGIPASNGIVGIGKGMSDVNVSVVSGDKELLAELQPGELCISGPQVTLGYLNNAAQNEKSFFELHGERYYRTGDLVQWDKDGNMQYLGRIDDQVKVQGYRIELAELELAAQKIHPEIQSVAVGFKDQNETWFLALYVLGDNISTDELREKMRSLLPDYMVPHYVFNIDEFPLNSNGKTDKKLLREKAMQYQTS